MVMLLFTYVDPVGEHRTYSYGGPSLEAGLDIATTLINEGSRLLGVKLISGNRSMELPIDAFDGFSFEKPLRKLQQEWETILVGK